MATVTVVGGGVASEIEDDGALAARARLGDADAFARLVERHRAGVRSLLHRLSGAPHLDDLEQDVFVASWRGLRTYRGDAAFGTWLRRIAAHRAKRFLARRRPEPEPLPEDGEGALRGGPHRDAARSERAAAVRRAVEALSPALRVAFVLRYVEGLSGAETAEILGRPEGTVRSLLFDARRALSKSLGEEIVDDDGDASGGR